jgi:hypothetical protein
MSLVSGFYIYICLIEQECCFLQLIYHKLHMVHISIYFQMKEIVPSHSVDIFFKLFEIMQQFDSDFKNGNFMMLSPRVT